MTDRQLTVPLAGDGPAVLILPRPLTPESLSRLEQSLAEGLAGLRREMAACAADPGLVEYESWMQHLRPARQAHP